MTRTTSEVGRMAGCSRWTVERMIRDGVLDAERGGDGRYQIGDDDARRFAARYQPFARHDTWAGSKSSKDS